MGAWSARCVGTGSPGTGATVGAWYRTRLQVREGAEWRTADGVAPVSVERWSANVGGRTTCPPGRTAPTIPGVAYVTQMSFLSVYVEVAIVGEVERRADGSPATMSPAIASRGFVLIAGGAAARAPSGEVCPSVPSQCGVGGGTG